MSRLSRPESRARTREALLQSAQHLITRKGYEGTSLADIVERAGFTKGAFFAHFESKDALLLELLHRHQQDDMARLAAAVDGPTSPEQALDAYIAGLADQAECALLDIELKLQAMRNPGFAAQYDALAMAMRQRLAQLLEDWCLRTGQQPAAPTLQLAELFIGVVQGLTLQRHADPGAAIQLLRQHLFSPTPVRSRTKK